MTPEQKAEERAGFDKWLGDSGSPESPMIDAVIHVAWLAYLARAEIAHRKEPPNDA